MDYESLSSDDLKQILDDPHFQEVSQRVKIRDELARRNREEQAELARREREERKDRRWLRGDKIGFAVLIVTVLTFFATFDWSHSDKPKAVSKPQGSSAEACYHTLESETASESP